MIEATTLHIKRLMGEGQLDKISELQCDLFGLKLRLGELENRNG